MNYHLPFYENECYHVFNRANGSELFFKNDDNYSYFLQKIKKYILPVAEIYAYCLLPNHYHLLMRVKNAEMLQQALAPGQAQQFDSTVLSSLVSSQFNRLQNSYAKAFNKANNRKGSLFINPFRRVEITSDAQFGSAVFYIHKNPVHHGLCHDMMDWTYSSYRSYHRGNDNLISAREVFNYFGDINGFQQYHEQAIEVKRSYEPGE